MYCQYCGAQIEDGCEFCTSCGKRQEDDMGATRAADATADPTVTVDLNMPPESTFTMPPAEPSVPARRRSPWLAAVLVLIALAIPTTLWIGTWQFGWFASDASGQAVTKEGQAPLESDDKPVVQMWREVEKEESSEGDGSVQQEPKKQEDSVPSQQPVSGAKEGDADDAMDGGVAVRSGLAAYSWGELSEIAKEIEASDSSDEALVIAKRYNLVDASGRYGSATKDVQLSDGKTVHMRLVGVWHDRADTASGRAGLSFLSDGIVTRRAMHAQDTIDGGWEASDMRSWLSQSLERSLPSEVSSVIFPVHKKSNNVGETRTASSVTETTERLWLPSVIEICGPVYWTYESDPSNSDAYNSVHNAEGSQYEAFAQMGIDNFGSNGSLALGGDWWLRSVAPPQGKGRYVGDDGNPSYFGRATREHGVVVGFCL